MNDLTKLSNEQLGDFIQISLIHGTNTQFSYELLHEVASRLKHTDEIIKAGINYALKNQDVETIKPLSFTFDEVAQALDEVLAENANEDNDETKKAVEIITDLMAHEAMDKAIKESAKGDSWVFNNPKAMEEAAEEIEKLLEDALVQETPVKKTPKKEKPTVKDSFTVEPAPTNAPVITGKMLKERAMEMRQSNVISADAIRGKLTEFGATSILTLDTKYHVDFYNFLESYNV